MANHDETGENILKRLILGCILGFLLAGCSNETTVTEPNTERTIHSLQREIADKQPEIDLQENLARWYNLNLREPRDAAFRDAYWEILFYSDGMMGSLKIGELHLPIYHGIEAKKGFGHDPTTPFPIGETGEHPVLIIDSLTGVEVGVEFTIHILDRELIYRVIAIRETLDIAAVPGMDYCSIITADGTQYLGLRIG